MATKDKSSTSDASTATVTTSVGVEVVAAAASPADAVVEEWLRELSPGLAGVLPGGLDAGASNFLRHQVDALKARLAPLFR